MKFYLDNELRQTYTLPRTVYFLDRGRVYVGGSADTPKLTDNLVQLNLEGTLSDVSNIYHLSTSQLQGENLLIGNVIAYVTFNHLLHNR